MSSRNFHVLAPLCLTLGGCIIELQPEDETGSTGADVETSEGESSTGDLSGGSEEGDASSGSTGDPPMSSCGEQPVVASHSGEIGTEVWSAGIHDVDDTYITGALTVEPCAILRMAPSATLSVREGGSLAMDGTEDERILVTSQSTTPGSWGLIDFGGDSTAEGNRLINVDVEYGGDGGESQVWLDSDSSVEIRDSSFMHSAGVGIRADADATLRGFEGNVISDNEGAAMRLHPSVVGDLGAGTYGPNATHGIVVASGVLTEDAVWSVTDAPYLVDDMPVDGDDASTTLELTAGTEIRFSPQGGMRIRANAALRLMGTEAEPVIVQSSSPRPAAGDWEEIRIEEGSLGPTNRFEHAEIRHGGGEGVGMVFVESGAELAISNSLLELSGGPGVTVQRDSVLRAFDGNTVTNNVGPALNITAGAVGGLGVGTYSPNGVDAIVVDGGVVQEDSTWLAHDAPYHLNGNTRVETRAGSAVLTVSAGTQLLLGPGAGVDVDDNGGLRLEGTPEARIRFASSQLPPSAGDWDYVHFDAASIEAQNVWTHVDVAHGAGAGAQFGQLWVRSGAALSLNDVTFAESGSGCDVRVSGAGILELQGTTAVQCD